MQAAGTQQTASRVGFLCFVTLSHPVVVNTVLGGRLDQELQGWISEAGEPEAQPVRAIIAPHAGFSYSGPTAAYAYKEVCCVLVVLSGQ
jgi:hypothetical protein